MQKRRLVLGALIPLLFMFLVLFVSPITASPLEQAEPPEQGQTTDVANLRSGPGTNYAKVGSVPAGTTVTITGCNRACDWYQVESGAWIAAFLVEPAAGDRGPATPQATAVATNTATLALPTPTPVTNSPSNSSATGPAGQVSGPSSSSKGNLRAGPGTNYGRVGGVQAGQALEITGRNDAGDWYQLADGSWIAAFLVANAPADAAVVATTAAPAVPTSPAAPVVPLDSEADTQPDTGLQEVMQQWQDGIELNTTKTCGHFEYKVTDVRRKKSVWWGSSEYVAQGDWLMVFVEVKNVSSGTSYFGKFGPRLITVTPDGLITATTGEAKASAYASWMFSHGRFYGDVNPGQVLGLVEAYDLSLEPDLMLGLALVQCPDDMLSLGLWSKVQPAAK